MLRKCLFPAAGYGTRFLPATKAMPKEMMPVVNRPLIEFGVSEALSAGLTDICMVTGRGKRALEDHFDVSYELEHQIAGSSKEKYLAENRAIIDSCRFSYTRQREMKGLGHAILSGRNLINDEPFAVLLADDLCLNLAGESVLSQMKDLYQQHMCSIVAVMEVPESQIHNYGVVSGEYLTDNLLKVDDMVEKPIADEAPSNLAVIGRYILTPDIFNVLESIPPGKGGEIQLTDALCQLAKQGNVLAYKFEGKRFDCGSMDGYVEATNYYYHHFYKKS